MQSRAKTRRRADLLDTESHDEPLGARKPVPSARIYGGPVQARTREPLHRCTAVWAGEHESDAIREPTAALPSPARAPSDGDGQESFSKAAHTGHYANCVWRD